ncbi:hypothetical protein Syun_029051 [Stephania yunnanensis]|uniref:Uncharacterized protein n=1 Tax=Stephania yunnanensis TaxID=152371 RepID=A0AAP0E980_9MAGN
MVQFCLMASSTYYCPWSSVDQGLFKSSKDSQAFLSSQPARKEIINSDACHLKLSYPRDSWESRSSMLLSNQFAMLNSALRDPVLGSMKDAHPDLMLLSFGIAEHCVKREKVLNFLMYGASESSEELDVTMLGKMMGLYSLNCNVPQQSLDPFDDESCLYEVDGVRFQPSILYPKAELNLHGSQFDYACDSIRSMPLCDGQVFFSGNRVEMKDLLSVAAEFQLSSRSRCKSMVVPYFTRSKTRRVPRDVKDASLDVENVMVAPLKSPSKMKSSPKRKTGGSVVTERDMYRRNYLHACEVMLSLIADKRGKAKMDSLKKSGPELSVFLAQCSAGIAGAGLAILLSVVCKVAGARVPFSALKILNTGLGFGLFWLSSAVNKLRNDVMYLSRKSNKLQLKEEEIMQNVDRSMNEIFFRSAALLAVFILRVA